MENGIFIGVCVGSGVLFLLIVIMGFLCARKRRKRNPIEFLAPSERPLLGQSDCEEQQYQTDDPSYQEDPYTGHGYTSNYDPMMPLHSTPKHSRYSIDNLAEKPTSSRNILPKTKDSLLLSRELFRSAGNLGKSNTGFHNSLAIQTDKSASHPSYPDGEKSDLPPERFDSVLLHSHGGGKIKQSFYNDKNEFFASNYSEHNGSVSQKRIDSKFLHSNCDGRETVQKPHDDMMLRRMSSSAKPSSKQRSQSTSENVKAASQDMRVRSGKLRRSKSTGYTSRHPQHPQHISGIPAQASRMSTQSPGMPHDSLAHNGLEKSGRNVKVPQSENSTRRYSVKDKDKVKQKQYFHDSVVHGITANNYYSQVSTRDVPYHSYSSDKVEGTSHRPNRASGHSPGRRSWLQYAGENSDPTVRHHDSMQATFVQGPVPRQKIPDLHFNHDSSINQKALQSPPPQPRPHLSPVSQRRLKPPPQILPTTPSPLPPSSECRQLSQTSSIIQTMPSPLPPSSKCCHISPASQRISTTPPPLALPTKYGHLSPASQRRLKTPPLIQINTSHPLPRPPKNHHHLSPASQQRPKPPPLNLQNTTPPLSPLLMSPKLSPQSNHRQRFSPLRLLATPTKQPHGTRSCVSPRSSLPFRPNSVSSGSPSPVGALMSPKSEKEASSGIDEMSYKSLEPDNLSGYGMPRTSLENGMSSVVRETTFESFPEQQMTNHALPPPPLPIQSAAVNQSSMPYNTPAQSDTITAQSEHGQSQYTPTPPATTSPLSPSKRSAMPILINSPGTLNQVSAGSSLTQENPSAKPVHFNAITSDHVAQIRKIFQPPPPTPPPKLSEDPLLLNQQAQHTSHGTPVALPKNPSGRPQHTAMSPTSAHTPIKPCWKPVMLPTPENHSPSYLRSGACSKADSLTSLNKAKLTSSSPYPPNQMSPDSQSNSKSGGSPKADSVTSSNRVRFTSPSPNPSNPKSPDSQSTARSPIKQYAKSVALPPPGNLEESTPVSSHLPSMFSQLSPPGTLRPLSFPAKPAIKQLLPSPPQSPIHEPISPHHKARIHVFEKTQEISTDSETHKMVIDISSDATHDFSQSKYPKRHSIATDNHKQVSVLPSTSKSPKKHSIAAESVQITVFSSAQKFPKRQSITTESGQNLNVTPTPYKSPKRHSSAAAEKSQRLDVSFSPSELPLAPASSPCSSYFKYPNCPPPTPEIVEQILASPKHTGVETQTHTDTSCTSRPEEEGPPIVSPINDSVEMILDNITDENMQVGNPPDPPPLLPEPEQPSTSESSKVDIGYENTEENLLIHEHLLKRRQRMDDSDT